MSEQKNTLEPFGYFRAETFGWTDCVETDEGAIPLYDQAAVAKLQCQRDELLAAAEAIEINAEECLDFDECTAMLIPIDDYHKLMEAGASAKDQSSDTPATANHPHRSLVEAVELERNNL